MRNTVVTLLTLINLFGTAKLAFTQDTCCFTIGGYIRFKGGGLVSSAALDLLQSRDSSIVTSAISSTTGAFFFKQVPKGDYLIGLRSNKKNFSSLSEHIAVNSSILQLNVLLNEPTSILQTVMISSRRPFLQRENDRLVINLENSSLTRGNSVLQALPKLPGIEVLQGKNITVNGNGDVLIIIDGKQYKSSSAQALQILGSLRSEQIERLEIITTPSAKFDAEGSSIINIILKKDKVYSTATFSFAQLLYPIGGESGVDYNQFNGGINLFASSGRFKFNTQISGGTNANLSAEQTNVQFPNAFRLTDASTESTIANLYANFTTNYTKNNYTIGLALGYTKTFLTRIRSQSQESFLNTNKEIDSQFLARIDTRSTSCSPTASLSYDNLLNKVKNQLLSISFITGVYSNDYDIAQRVSQGSSIKYFLEQDQMFSVRSRAMKADYGQNIKQVGRLEGGLKWTSSKNTDNYDVMSVPSSSFSFHEDILAAYLNVNHTANKKFSYALGIRAEKITNKAHSSLLPGIKVRRNYFDVFPSSSLQYVFSRKAKVGASLSRRIIRPSYNNFNPARFVLFNDPFAIQEGSIDLLPQYLSKVDVYYQVNRLFSSVTYTYKKNIRTVIALEGTSNHIDYRTINISGYDAAWVVSYNLKPTKWFETGFNILSQYSSYQLPHNSCFNNVAIRISNSQAYTISSTTKVDVSSRYYSALRREFFRVGNYFVVDLGMNKSLIHDLINVNFSINDALGTSKPAWTYFYPEIMRQTLPLTNGRRLNISVSYRFKTGNKFLLKRKQIDDFGETRFYK